MKKIYQLMVVSFVFSIPLVSHAFDFPCHPKYDGMQQKVAEQDSDFAQPMIWQNESICIVSEAIIRDSDQLKFKMNGQEKVVCLSGITGSKCSKA